MKKALIITAVGGFLAQFERSDVGILQELGYEVHYASNFQNPVYPFREDELVQSGIRLHQIDIQKSPARIRENFRAFLQVRHIIESERVELVHCHNPVGAVAARCAAQSLARKPYVIYTAHGFHFYAGAPMKNWAFFYNAEAFLARWTDMVITINEEDCARARQFRLRKGGAVGKIPGVGVDMERFRPRPGLRNEVRKELGIPEQAFHIVTAAELNRNKNQRMVVEALSMLEEEDVYYSICGRGDQEQALRRLVREKGLEGRVFLLGYRTDMERVLQSADCFAFPSYREGLGIAAVEALSAGIPLIVADNRGTREYAQDGVNAVVCSRQEAAEYARAVRRLCTDRIYRNSLAEKSRGSAEPFSIGAARKIMRALYAEADRHVEEHGRLEPGRRIMTEVNKEHNIEPGK